MSENDETAESEARLLSARLAARMRAATKRPAVGLDLDDRVEAQLVTAAQRGLKTSRWRDSVSPYRHHAACWGIWSPAMDEFKADLLANGWSVYTPSCLVYGVTRR